MWTVQLERFMRNLHLGKCKIGRDGGCSVEWSLFDWYNYTRFANIILKCTRNAYIISAKRGGLNMAFHDRLKEARINARFTQEQLAERIGVAKSTLSGYENGNREPSVATVAKLLQILRVDANYLYQVEMANRSSSEMLHIEKYRSLDRHGRELVDMVLDKELQRVNNIPFVQNTIKGFDSLSEEDLETIQNGLYDGKEQREIV